MDEGDGHQVPVLGWRGEDALLLKRIRLQVRAHRPSPGARMMYRAARAVGRRSRPGRGPCAGSVQASVHGSPGWWASWPDPCSGLWASPLGLGLWIVWASARDRRAAAEALRRSGIAGIDRMDGPTCERRLVIMFRDRVGARPPAGPRTRPRRRQPRHS